MIAHILNFLGNMPTEITNTLIGAISCTLSAFISAFISSRIAKKTTLAEIAAEKEKREDTWKHEREAAYNTEFSEMVTSITAYLSDRTEENYKKAVSAINVLRVKEISELATNLDMLYFFISDENHNAFYMQQLASELNRTIEQKRNYDRQQAAANH